MDNKLSCAITSTVSYQQIQVLSKRIIEPVCAYTKESLELKRWNKTYYLHEYVPSRKWKYVDDENEVYLSRAIYGFKTDIDSELEFELLWAILQICKEIPEDNIFLFNVPSSREECTETPIVEMIRELGATHSSVFVTFMKELFCKDKRFIDCSDYIVRTTSIVSNHERARKGMRRASFEEQISSMDCSDEFVEYTDNLREDGVTGSCLILDDIMTNGCTINAAYGVLKRQAYKFCKPDSIYKLVLAKTAL